MARIVADGWATESKAIAIDRETAVLVDGTGYATIVANADHPTPYAYFIRGGAPQVVMPKTPRAWEGACSRAGLTGLQLRDLRHEAGSRFDEAGVPVNFVSRLLVTRT